MLQVRGVAEEPPIIDARMVRIDGEGEGLKLVENEKTCAARDDPQNATFTYIILSVGTDYIPFLNLSESVTPLSRTFFKASA